MDALSHPECAAAPGAPAMQHIRSHVAEFLSLLFRFLAWKITVSFCAHFSPKQDVVVRIFVVGSDQLPLAAWHATLSANICLTNETELGAWP